MKAARLKVQIEKKLRELNINCGYSIMLSIASPNPIHGKKGKGLVLNLSDKVKFVGSSRETIFIEPNKV